MFEIKHCIEPNKQADIFKISLLIGCCIALEFTCVMNDISYQLDQISGLILY